LRNILLLVSLGFYATSANSAGAQPLQTTAVVGAPTTISEGQRFTLHSAILGEDRVVFVSMPPSYDGTRRYPVLYLTDGQFNFDEARSSAGFLSRNVLIPQTIVVGVVNKDRTRDLYATKSDFKFGSSTMPFPNSGNADKFLEFIQRELIPWVDANYRTMPLRIFAGQSAGGNFALHAMRTEPMLFQGIIAISPWLAWDNHREIRELEPFLATAKAPVRALFFSYTDPVHDGPDMKGDIDALSAALRKRNEPALRWATSTYPGETHDSTFVKGFYDGLRMIFAGWEYPTDRGTNALIGSLEDVKAHYAKFGESLGVEFLPPPEMISALGYRDLRQGKIDTALQSFRFYAETYPQAPDAWDSLADGLERAGKLQEALTARRKALAIAEATHNSDITTYRDRAARLAERLKATK
jgi:Predicted hydrolase of the alpha/beta superfamily